MSDVFELTIYQQLVGGSGLRTTRYPINAAGTTLTASGKTTGAYKFAALGANVAAIVAKATLLVPWRLAWVSLDNPSAASIYVVRLGRGAAGGAAMATVLYEANATVEKPLPWCATVLPDALTDALLGDLASSNVAADDTALCSVGVMTGMGS